MTKQNTNHLLKITPVGGVGQIGSNMTLVQSQKDCIIIDAGILFPYEDFFDINYLIPDLSNIPTPSHLVITHGHEDHIGAIVDVVKKFPKIQIIATPFTLALIRKKLDFSHLQAKLVEYKVSDELGFHDFNIYPIHVNHSIPETVGLLIKDQNEKMGLFFTSDFKIDHNSPYERPFDFQKLKRLTANLESRILLCDSTNITSSSLTTKGEAEIIPVMDELLEKAPERVFITCFSSNIHRLSTIINLAVKHNKKVVPYGRSMISYLNSANELGMIPNFEKAVRMPETVKGDTENLIVLLSGCQGDFRGTFRRYCMGEDSIFKPRPTDTVILSSKAIPGNEKKISMLLNKLAEVNCHIFTPQTHLVHVSGHPGRKDLLELFSEFKPHHIIPIHGETYFIREHIKFIQEEYPNAQTHYILNSDELTISQELKLKTTQCEHIEPILIHGNGIEIQRPRISERRKLACNGAIFVSLKLSSTRAKVESLTYDYLGLPDVVHENDEKFKKFLNHYFIKINFKDVEATTEDLRVAIRKYFDQMLGYKPMTTVHVL